MDTVARQDRADLVGHADGGVAEVVVLNHPGERGAQIQGRRPAGDVVAGDVSGGSGDQVDARGRGLDAVEADLRVRSTVGDHIDPVRAAVDPVAFHDRPAGAAGQPDADQRGGDLVVHDMHAGAAGDRDAQAVQNVRRQGHAVRLVHADGIQEHDVLHEHVGGLIDHRGSPDDRRMGGGTEDHRPGVGRPDGEAVGIRARIDQHHVARPQVIGVQHGLDAEHRLVGTAAVVPRFRRAGRRGQAVGRGRGVVDVVHLADGEAVGRADRPPDCRT